MALRETTSSSVFPPLSLPWCWIDKPERLFATTVPPVVQLCVSSLPVSPCHCHELMENEEIHTHTFSVLWTFFVFRDVDVCFCPPRAFLRWPFRPHRNCQPHALLRSPRCKHPLPAREKDEFALTLYFDDFYCVSSLVVYWSSPYGLLLDDAYHSNNVYCLPRFPRGWLFASF